MREIKFRGFNRKNNVWLYGFLMQNRCAHFVCPDEWATGKSWDDYEIDHETLGQFTGLYDKDGKEIYEGDILADSTGGIRHIVSYEDKEGAFIGTIPGIHDGLGHPVDTNLRQWWLDKNGKRIIGNIHDQKEITEYTSNLQLWQISKT